jgi:photosystem II stability/assembly factor-like uncharacterized protein
MFRRLAFCMVCCALASSAQNISKLQTNTTENLRGVSALSSKVAWASGTHGTYLRTVDGVNWIANHVPGAESLDFRDVEAFSPDVAYLLSAGPGDQSRIYKTTDAGRNWTLQFSNPEPTGFYDCMAFWDRDHGIALGDPVAGKFELLMTEDGGRKWTRSPSDTLPAAENGEGAFAASGTCIAVHDSNIWFATGGKVARVFLSTDRGKSWKAVPTPLPQGNDSSGIFSIAFRDRKHGIIAGGDYKQPEKGGKNLAFTEDGGHTWKVSALSPQAYFSAVAFDPERADSFIAVGTKLIGYGANPKSKNWTTYSFNLNSVSFYAAAKAFAVGPEGTIVHFAQPSLAASSSSSSSGVHRTIHDQTGGRSD